MHPILLNVGPITLHTYGAMLVVALVVSTWFASRAARQLPQELVAIPPQQVVDFNCLVLLGGVLGGRVLYVLLEWEFFRRAPQEIPALWHGGLVWYGGFFGGLASAWCYARAYRVAFLRVADQSIPFLVLGHAIGRIGCFLNGCCYGRPTTLWCGVVFPDHAEAVLPTQLFEAVGLFGLYLLLRHVRWPAILRQPGALLGRYLIGYALLRFVVEWFRGDQTVWWAGLTLQQLISVVLVMIGIGLVGRFRPFRRRDRRN